MKEIGIYVHIPFCKSKCHYCDFISYIDGDIERYIKTLLKEIENVGANIIHPIIKTIYIGGGTPSYIDSNHIIKIMDTIKTNFNVDKNAEITIEVNPGSVTEEKLICYKRTGINRISIGLQTTNNSLLKKIGRIHTYEEFKESYSIIKKVGFTNTNIDLIFGLPEQNLEDVKKDLNKIIKLNPNHISLYSLILEKGTKLYEFSNQLPDEEIERQMYWGIKNKLELVGYKHYEISNFAKPGFESKHNLNCWNQEEYLGFGVAAHSYYNNIRYSNTDDINDYVCAMSRDSPINEEQTEESKMKEYMMLKLRTTDGVYVSEFKQKFRINPIILFRNELDYLVSEKLLEVDLDRIYLTNKGLDFANKVFEKFI